MGIDEYMLKSFKEEMLKNFYLNRFWREECKQEMESN